MASADPAPAPRRRNRAETEQRLRSAVGELIVEGGFAALSASAVARRAGVDKMLIYRYFGDLEGLVRAVAFGPDFFPTFEELCDGLTPDELRSLPVSARTAHILDANARTLMLRPVVLELMVQEMVERNALTAIMEEARESLGLRIMDELYADVADRTLLGSVSAVLSAGVTYLVLRQRKIRWYAGVDLKSEAGWAGIVESIRRLTASLD